MRFEEHGTDFCKSLIMREIQFRSRRDCKNGRSRGRRLQHYLFSRGSKLKGWGGRTRLPLPIDRQMLEGSGLSKASQFADHESARTTGLYDSPQRFRGARRDREDCVLTLFGELPTAQYS